MNSEIIPPEYGYNIYRNDRDNCHGGVLLAIVDRISSVDLTSFGADCEIGMGQS